MKNWNKKEKVDIILKKRKKLGIHNLKKGKI